MRKGLGALTCSALVVVLGAVGGVASAQDAAPVPLDATSPDFYGAVLGDSFSGPIEGDERVVYAVGGIGQPVWIRQPGFEVRCDSVVIWGDKEALVGALEQRDEEDAPGAEQILGPVMHTIYAEGNVFLRRAGQVIRAEKVLIDFAENRAYMVDAQLSGTRSSSGGVTIPLRIRAAVIRGNARSKFQAERASFTTCSYEHPHYRFTTDRLDVEFFEDYASFETGAWPTIRADTLLGDDTPIFTLPVLGGSSITTDPLQDVTLGNSGRFGTEIGLVWGGDLAHEDGRKWGTWNVLTDWRSRRGAGVGFDMTYEGARRADGARDEAEFTSYFQRDEKGDDEFSERSFDGTTRPSHRDERARAHLWYRRHGTSDGLLPEGWRLDTELSYYSDRGFLPEYFKDEALTEKQQDTYVQLRRTWGNEGVSLLASYRLNDEATSLIRSPADSFLTDYQVQTQYLPSASYHLINEPLVGEDYGIRPNLSVQASAANVKRRYDDAFARGLRNATGWNAEHVLRGDVEARVSAPFSFGPIHVNPSVGGSFMAVDEANGFSRNAFGIDDSHSDERGAGWYEVRAGTEVHKVFDVRSEFFDLNGLRHVSSLDAQYLDRFQVDEDGDPFAYQVNDLIDLLDEIEIGSVRWRNRLQTKRDGEIVDWLDYEVRFLHFFGDTPARRQVLGLREDFAQPLQRLGFPGEDKYRRIARHGSALNQHRLRWQFLPDVWFVGEYDYDSETNHAETSAAGIRVAVSDRLSLYVGRRTILGDSRIITVRGDYRLTDKWAIGVEQRSDTRTDSSLETQITIYRRSHDYTITLEFDSEDLLQDNSLSIGLYPNHWLNPTGDPFSKRRVLDYEALRWYR